MSNAVFVMPFVATTPGLPTVAPGDLVPYADYETSALEHWVFGGDSTSLVGLVNGRQLTPQSSMPSFSSVSLTLPGQGEALISDIDDTHARTFFAVVRRPVQGAQSDRGVYWGNRGFSASFPHDGGIIAQANFFSVSAGGSVNTVYSDINGSSRSTSSLTYNNAGVDVGDWAFILVSESIDGFIVQINSTQAPGSATVERALAPVPYALGNAYYNNPDWKSLSLEFDEWGCVDGTADSAEATALYNRAKARCARRGITVA